MQLRIVSLQYLCILLITMSLSTAAPPAIDPPTALRQLGLLLGLPVDTDEAELERGEAPKFIKEVYDCWKRNEKNCVPGFHEDDVDLLKASLGMEIQSPLPAVHSYNMQRELKNSVAISFNISSNPSESSDPDIRYALLRVYRKPLSSDQLALLEEKCSNLSITNLQLYTQISATESHAVYALRAVQSLSPLNSTFSTGEWVEFLNLTSIYKQFVASIEKTPNKTSTATFHIRLSVGGSCASVSPSDLGFESVSEYRAQLIGIARETTDKDIDFSKIMSYLAHNQPRTRRQTSNSTAREQFNRLATAAPPPGSPTLATEQSTVPPPSSLPSVQNISRGRCALYHYYIRFADLMWNNFILYPSGYEANFCAGRCEWPLHSSERFSDKHAFIQAIANFRNPTTVPPTCCTPSPSTMRDLPAIIRGTNGVVDVHYYRNMTATSCVCA